MWPSIVAISLVLSFSNANKVFHKTMCSDIYPDDAVNIVLVMHSVHQKSTNNETCGDMYEPAISEILQMFYELDQINKDLSTGKRILTGSLGIRVCDICEDSILQTIVFSENANYITKTLKKNIIGIISGTGSNNVADLAVLLDQYDLKIPIVTYTATKHDLTNEHKNVIQVIPEDSLQSNAIFKLIQKMGCNYVSVFSNDNSYSQTLRDSIAKLVEGTRNSEDPPLCINKYIQYDYREDDSVTLAANLQTILSIYENDADKEEDPVIVFLGYTRTYEELVKRINATIVQYPNVKNIHLINSEAALLDDEISLNVNAKIKFYKLSLNGIGTYTALSDYYNKTLESYASNMSRYLPWLDEYFVKKHNCSLLFDNSTSTSNYCVLAKIDRKLPDSQYLRYLIYSMTGFYEQLLITISLVCPLETSFDNCEALSGPQGLALLTRELRTMTLNFEQYPFMVDEIRISAVIVDGKYQVSDEITYSLSNNSQVIANFKNSEWITDVNLKRDNCICKHVCYECLPIPEYVLEPGDVYLTSVMSQNQNQNNSKCSPLTSNNEYSWWMSFHEALETLLTDRKSEFPNISKVKIGTIMLNDCDIPEYAYYKLLTLETKYKHLYENTIAMIGSSASGITDSILRYNAKENIITVSAVSTSPALSNRTNFCRVVPDDNEQVNAINRLMLQFGWNTAIFLYSNNNYGINGLSAFKANNPNINLYEKFFDNNFIEVVRFVESTSQTDVVIMFANADDINTYFDTMTELKSRTKKFYIGSDFWATYQTSVSGKNAQYYLGAVVVKLGVEEDSITIGKYIADKYSKMKNSNQSFYADQFFNQRLECNRANSFTNFYQPYKVCESNFYSRITSYFKSDPSRKDYMNIAYALLLSFENYMKSNCPASDDKPTLVNCLKNARSLIKPYLQNVTLPVDFRNNINAKLFNSATCNGQNLQYTLETVGPPLADPVYKKYAIYDNGVLKANVDLSRLKFYTLNGSEVDERTIQGYFKKPLGAVPVPIIPELEACKKEVSEFQNVIAGVAVAIAVITVSVLSGTIYYALELYKKRKEYHKEAKRSRERDSDYENISAINSIRSEMTFNERLRRILYKLNILQLFARKTETNANRNAASNHASDIGLNDMNTNYENTIPVAPRSPAPSVPSPNLSNE